MNSITQDVYKVILVGDQGVGKSSILMRYTQNIFKREYTVTIGLEFASKKISVQDNNLTLQIWDTAGQEAFRSIVRSFYRNSAAIIIVYKVTSRETFLSVKDWAQEITENGDEGVVITLVGNMIDMQNDRKISFEEGQELAESINALFFETSAQDGINIDDIFQKTLEKAYQNPTAKSMSDANIRDSLKFASKTLLKEDIKQQQPNQDGQNNFGSQQFQPPKKEKSKGCC